MGGKMIAPAVAALAHLPAASSVPGYAPEEVTWWWMAVGLGLVVVEKIDNALATTADLVVQIVGHAEPIVPGLQQINRTLGIISGALPLLYRLAERIEGVAAGRIATGSNTAGTMSGTGNYTGVAGIK